MNFPKLFLKLVLLTFIFPLPASALVMRANGPEPVIVEIKESLRTSDDLDQRLNELASRQRQNGLKIEKWWAGRKLLVMLSFPSTFTEQRAMAVIEKLQQLPAVEKVVAASASNLVFRPGDFAREYNPTDAIPDVARRGFDADRIGRRSTALPSEADLASRPHIPNRLIVAWKEEYIWKADQSGFHQTMSDLHHQTGCRVVDEFSLGRNKLSQVLEFDPPGILSDKLRQYKDSGFVVYAEPDYIYEGTMTPDDPAYSFGPGPQWNLPIIKAPEAWSLTTGDPSHVIAVGDSGANVNHPEFSPNLWSGQNNGEIKNFVSDSTNVDDDFVPVYHGSNVAAIIGAQGGNGAYMTGVAWNTSLMILKVLNSANRTDSGKVARALKYAWERGASAINLSLRGFEAPTCYSEPNDPSGAYCNPADWYNDTIYTAMQQARANNMVVVTGAGNDTGPQDRWIDGTTQRDNDDNMNRKWPASVPTDNTISVLATTSSDTPASYSNIGRYRVDLGAPGGSEEAKVMGLKQDTDGNSFNSDNYSFLQGTSMAAPHVAGAISLIKSLFPWENYFGLRDRVLMGVDRLASLNGLCRTNGRLNAYKSLQRRSMLRNLSTRARVEGGDRVMVAGFVIGGSPSGGALKVCIRGLGPSVGVSGQKLGNPRIELYASNGAFLDANNNWHEDWNMGDVLANNLQPSNNNEATLIRWLNPGSYTVVLRDEGADYGVGLFEIYEMQGNNEQSRLINLSTRCLVGTGDEEAIAGTIIGDVENATGLPKPDRRVLIFGKGPSLAAYGLSGTLQDPQIEVSETGESNSQWYQMDDDSGSGDALEEELYEAGFATHALDAGLWPTFTPGFYTVKLRGTNQGTGIGLIELYEY